MAGAAAAAGGGSGGVGPGGSELLLLVGPDNHVSVVDGWVCGVVVGCGKGREGLVLRDGLSAVDTDSSLMLLSCVST